MAQPVTPAVLRQQTPPGAVDPNVKIPKHVAEAGKRSEAIQNAMLGAAEPSVVSQIEGQPAQTPPQPPANGAEQHPPQGQEEPTAPGQNGQARGPVDWERQFKSLNGRVEAEMKKSRDAIAQLSDQLHRTQQENAALRNQQPLQPDPNAQPTNLLTQQEIEDYGPDFIDVMRRTVAEATAPLNDEIGRLRAQMGHVQQETGNAFLTRMNATIGGLIPNWNDLNKDARFVEWSNLPDVFSGAIRKVLMQEAWNSGDAHRVAAFFQAFLAEVAATNPQGGNGQRRPTMHTVVGDQSLIPSPSSAPLDLTTLAAPGRAQSAGGAPAEKPVYTAAEITRFYTDVAAGRWRGQDVRRAAIDADIILAQHEGRIIPDNRTQAPRDPYTR